ncbi:delta 1-pyrroline-5-carboxylate synthetase [Methanobrevibacter sp. DSM 116169]|uniref:amino acid kinase family protein n=1 Tax=Methanobrevibacter sp. DSM 116169 TaxID=3242727 RepID=UPI0038FD3CCD
MEWVIKIGGSLFPNYAIDLAKSLKGTKTLIIIGGGEFANLIRKYDDNLDFSSKTSHETAIDSMDILAKLLNDKVESAKLAYTIEESQKAIDEGFNPIMITSKILNENNPFEHSWDVTSDSIAAYFANLLKAKLLIATNVQGIYNRKPSEKNSKFISEIDAKKLLTFKESSIDLKLPSLLIKFGTNCYVVNGKYPVRVLSIISNDINNYNFKYTKIIGD